MEDLSTKVVEIIDCEGASNICEEVASSSQANNGSQDFSFICRICALKTHNTMPLFEGEGAEQKLMEKINKYLPVQISHNDGLPSVICYQCSSALLTWHELVECCVQADASFRKQLALAGSLSVNMSSSSKCDVDNLDEDTLKYKRSVMFLTMVVNVLTEYFKSNQLDIETDWEYVCQKCDDKPMSKNVQCLSEHLKMKHGNELFNRQTVAQFIENYITFEEALLSDDEVQGPDNKEQNKKKKSPRDVVCFFCECAFTSTRRLMFHLNKHLDMPKDGGILCCDNIYDDLNLFEIHISEKHSIQKIVGHVCKTCGFAAPDEKMLKKHIQREHSASEPRPEFKEKKKFGPKNQKNFPAVCPECNKTFSNKYNMSHHMRLHRAPKFDCPKCDKSYRAKSSLVHHMEVVHEGKLRFPCPACGEAFPTRLARDVHARLHSGATPFECQYCGKAFRARNTLHNHLKAHLDVRAHACPLCPNRWIDTRYHVNGDDRVKYETVYSNGLDHDSSLTNDSDGEPLSSIAIKKANNAYNKFYKALVKLRDHFVEEHTEECSYPDFTESSSEEERDVGFEVDTYDDLTLCNMRRDRMDDETRKELNDVQTRINAKVYYVCKICGKKLSSSHTYLYHKKIHTGERPCVCHVCGKTFRAPNGLQRHLKETHERVKRYVCALCAKTFVNSQNLRQHMRIHTGERPFVCPQCGKRFTQSGSLHAHAKTHSDLFPFNCNECGAKFRLRAGLSKHKLKHTGERPHVCVNCGKGFRQKHELNNHVLIHSDAKPFACSACGATFRQRRALRLHAKKSHDTRDVSCHVYSQVPY